MPVSHLIPTPSNCFNYEASLASQTPVLKTAVTAKVAVVHNNIWKDKAKELVSQGDLAKLLDIEEADVTWKSLIYGVPKGVMSFAMRASTNTLATPENLKKWKKIRNYDC